MKIIDILNKIANGDEVPKKIFYRGGTYHYIEEDKDYYNTHAYGLFDSYVIPDILNDEVTILETTITYNGDQRCTEATNKIEKIDIYDSYTSHNNLHTYINTYDKDGKIKRFVISAPQREIIIKINEIIDRLYKEVK